MENILSTCFEASTVATRTIASYSHVIPIILSMILGIFVFIKAKFNLLSKIFLIFVFTLLFIVGFNKPGQFTAAPGTNALNCVAHIF